MSIFLAGTRKSEQNMKFFNHNNKIIGIKIKRKGVNIN
jgi:hypothetical protein